MKTESNQRVTEILQALSPYPNGLSLTELCQSLEHRFSKRTLQRHVAELVRNGELLKSGQGPKTRYMPQTPTARTADLQDILYKDIADNDVYFPLSEESKQIKYIVELPLQQRKPCGYHRAFLDKYKPNESVYLDKVRLEHLKKMSPLPTEEHLAGTYAKPLLNRLLIDLSWNSSRLEGNTYSLLETERLIQLGEISEGKNSFETQMILNHKRAIEFLIESKDAIGFNRHTLLNLHALLSENLLGNSEASGSLRRIPVRIGKTTYHPLEIPQLIDEAFQQILDTAKAIQNPFEQAFFVMVQLPYLQPFEDVNKRVSRLAANIPFFKHQLTPLSFIDVPEKAYIDGILGVCELNKIELLRDVFVWAYERSALKYAAIRHSLGAPDPFKMPYRKQIQLSIAYVVRHLLDKKSATKSIQEWGSQHIPKKDLMRFTEIAERELLSLHEGNIARYQIQPKEYHLWKQVWDIRGQTPS